MKYFIFTDHGVWITDSGTKGWVTTAISKMLAQIGRFPEDVKVALDNQTSLVDVDMIQVL